MSAAEQHRSTAAAFTAIVDRVGDWDVPTPVPEWRARDIVGHLVTWFPAFLAAGGVDLEPGPAPTDDPAGAWRHQVDQVQRLLDDPDRAASTFAHPHVGELPLADAVDRFYTADVFMHTWDLARARGQEIHLDPDRCAALLEGLAPIEDVLRGSGQYGPAHPVDPSARVQDRLMAFIGRDPDWAPPS